MQYITISELSSLIRNNLHLIPHDVDLVVGIPRSGMLPANLIALYLNVQLTDINSFVDRRVYASGYRMRSAVERPIKKVLIVDDSVQSGRAIKEARDKLQTVESEYDLSYMAPIVTSEGAEHVDIYLKIVDDFRLFEWNVFHHNFLSDACLDIDGVLCKDPEIDDDGPRYINYLRHAKPLYVPSVPVKALITCRLEKYRSITEQWLQEHGIRYEELVMLDLPDRSSRVKWGRYGEFKATYYKHSSALLFIESSANQAETIAKKSNKPVICVETNKLIDYSLSYNSLKQKSANRFPGLYNRVRSLPPFLHKACRLIIP